MKNIKLRNIVIILIVILLIICSIFIYNKSITKKYECSYNSKISDYSKYSISEKVNIVLKKDKLYKIIKNNSYKTLNNDKDMFNSFKEDKLKYINDLNEYKGIKGKLIIKDNKIITKEIYIYNKLNDESSKKIIIKKKDSIDNILNYYKKMGYICK